VLLREVKFIINYSGRRVVRACNFLAPCVTVFGGPWLYV
jgi:hypothetical protein